MSWRIVAAWLPAVILPTATGDQLLMLLRSGSSDNVSMLTWFLFLLANVGSLFIARPHSNLARLQMGLAFGLTALLDVGILIVIALNRSGGA